MDDHQLMINAARGDDASFEVLFRKWERPIFSFLYRALGSAEAAEDCLQETFVKLWRAAARYRPQCKFSTYLFRIATNAMIDHRRKHARSQGAADPPSRGTVGWDFDSIPSPDATPDERLCADELAEQINSAISELPFDQRVVFMLSQFAELSYAEIAGITSTRPGTVASRKFAAVRALERKLHRSLGGLGNELR